MFRDLLRFRYLLVLMTWRDIHVKYKQSMLGLLWAILMPMVIVAAGIVVKLLMSRISGKPLTPDNVVSVSIRAVPWAFFVAAIRFGTNSLTSNFSLVTKVYFPKLIIPLSAIFSQLFDFLIASGILAVILVFLKVPPQWELLWLPLLLAPLVVLATGLALLLAAASVFYRDVKYIVEALLTFAIFFTPVFFDVSMLGEWKTLMMLNPVAPLLEGISYVVVGQGVFDPFWVCYSAVVSTAILLLSLRVFCTVEPRFAECI